MNNVYQTSSIFDKYLFNYNDHLFFLIPKHSTAKFLSNCNHNIMNVLVHP